MVSAEQRLPANEPVRRGGTATRSAVVLPLALALLLSTGGCTKERPTSNVDTRACYNPPLDISRMEHELASRGVRFSRDGQCLTFKATDEVFQSSEFAA